MFRPKYSISDKIIRQLTDIAVSKDIVERAKLVPKWELSLRKEALIHTAHSSTHIEGNQLTLEEVSQLALGREVSAMRRDKQEVLNYLNVLSHLEKYSPGNAFSAATLLKIHKDLLKQALTNAADEGVFRNRAVVIGHRNEEGRAVVSFRPPLVSTVPGLIESFVSWLNLPQTKEVHAVLVAGIAHYELVRIHPFIDGNGRTARVLATLVLLARGFDTRRFFALDDYYDSDRIAYYDALKSVNPKTLDLTQWVEYFCEGVAFTVGRVRERIEQLSGGRRRVGTEPQVSLTERQMSIVEAIGRTGKITSREMQAMFSISPQAVHKEMKKLLKPKVVRLVGKGRAAHYELN
ncbi:MAG: Fic family protein [Deltaproteobacteria bacterium]|nr:Fic family protein [Deltaproteobacteria bacterium]MBI3295850.1 Fic family protein [Deltaproteobacteria bacterium]